MGKLSVDNQLSRRLIGEAELDLVLLSEWYDVDTPEDLERLKHDLEEYKDAAKFTRRFLKETWTN